MNLREQHEQKRQDFFRALGALESKFEALRDLSQESDELYQNEAIHTNDIIAKHSEIFEKFGTDNFKG